MNVQHAIKGQLSNHLELNERFHQLEQVVGRPVDRIECFDISHTMGEAQLPHVSCLTKVGHVNATTVNLRFKTSQQAMTMLLCGKP